VFCSSATQEQVAGSDEASDDTRSESEDNAQTRKFGSRVSTKGYARRRNFMDDFKVDNSRHGSRIPANIQEEDKPNPALTKQQSAKVSPLVPKPFAESGTSGSEGGAGVMRGARVAPVDDKEGLVRHTHASTSLAPLFRRRRRPSTFSLDSRETRHLAPSTSRHSPCHASVTISLISSFLSLTRQPLDTFSLGPQHTHNTGVPSWAYAGPWQDLMAGIAKLTGIELSKYDVPSSDPDADFLSEHALSSEDEIHKEKRKAAAAAMAKNALSKIGTKGKQAPGGLAQVAAAVPKASTKWGLGAFKSSVLQSVRSTVGLPDADSPSNVKTFERQDTTDSEEDHKNNKFGATSNSRVRSI